ncbi:CPBP family intramembrane glutamic endopeptidase [Flavobacterium sp. GT3R68]|uniref:CPBP family intramembrane glutamic endopeptidase n=1 Tax=Flavobacterium sp. GT3R68 TaxID=2594437 RepID=UPI0013153A1D|nr:CPBP family intramembrane glutamic endopeptidase [Flavobacterium sp. GT3R68]
MAIALITIVVIERFFRSSIDEFLGLITISTKGVYLFTNYYQYELYRIIWYFTIVLLATICLRLSIVGSLGLKNNFFKPFAFSLLVSLPMLLGYFTLATINFHKTDYIYIAVSSLVSAFGEEIYFRGFIFGTLFYRAKWGFIPAVLVSGVVFGIGHLYQTHDFISALGILLITFLGNAWFSWLFLITNRNIWLPIGMHFFMNFFWDSFALENGALGGWSSNIFRAITIILCTYFVYKKYKNSPQMIFFLKSIIPTHKYLKVK